MKKALLLKSGSGNEVATVSGIAMRGSGHEVPQRPKPLVFGTLSQCWKRCAKSKYCPPAVPAWDARVDGESTPGCPFRPRSGLRRNQDRLSRFLRCTNWETTNSKSQLCQLVTAETFTPRLHLTGLQQILEFI